MMKKLAYMGLYPIVQHMLLKVIINNMGIFLLGLLRIRGGVGINWFGVKNRINQNNSNVCNLINFLCPFNNFLISFICYIQHLINTTQTKIVMKQPISIHSAL